MSAPHPLITNIAITTATFDGPDAVIPDTLYGKDVPVRIMSHDHDGDPRSVTVWIGNRQFPVSEIQFILDAVKKHNAAVKVWNATKKDA
jgi:hypothetical protein